MFGYKQPLDHLIWVSLHKTSKWVSTTTMDEWETQCADDYDLVLVRYAAAHLASNPEKCKPRNSQRQHGVCSLDSLMLLVYLRDLVI